MYEKNLKFIFTDLDTGDTYQIGHNDWELTQVQGIFSPSFEVYTKSKANGRGLRVTGKQIKSRDITIVASATDTHKNDILRLAANKFFNPLHSFKVSIMYYNTTRWAECEILMIDCPQDNMDEPTELKLMLLCPNAFLKSVDSFGKDISSISAGFFFPYVSTIDNGFNCGFYNFGNEVTVVNEGDVETQCKVIFDAKGVCKNPKISKNAREYVRILKELQEGDEIIVDFENGEITYNGERCTSIDRTSTFFYLDRGSNKLTASADENIANLSTVIYYNSEFLGV